MIFDESLRIKLSPSKNVFNCSIFGVSESVAEIGAQSQSQSDVQTRNIYTLQFDNWVNVVPVTKDGQVILVEQHRFGTNTMTLETPGGMVEKFEKDVTISALRELEEETGYTSQRILSLPSFLPNPAIQNNKITFFLALDCTPCAQSKSAEDPFERIKIHFLEFQTLVSLVRSGQIKHSLAALAILLAEPFVLKK